MWEDFLKLRLFFLIMRIIVSWQVSLTTCYQILKSMKN